MCLHAPGPPDVTAANNPGHIRGQACSALESALMPFWHARCSNHCTCKPQPTSLMLASVGQMTITTSLLAIMAMAPHVLCNARWWSWLQHSQTNKMQR
jgi:hypothetical protein